MIPPSPPWVTWWARAPAAPWEEAWSAPPREKELGVGKFDGKTMGKTVENHGKPMEHPGKPWKIIGKPMGIDWKIIGRYAHKS